ncbi:hypothetical protein QTP86_029842 [Hemibagrus guttatus]|nr:hypothetical protein QTP86_029842 [Hemibagrus guttatus]
MTSENLISNPTTGLSTPTSAIPSNPTTGLSTPTSAIPSNPTTGLSTPTSAIPSNPTPGLSTPKSAIPSNPTPGPSTTTANITANTSTGATTTSTTITSTTVSPAAVFLLVFSINENFVPALADSNSQQFKDKANNITSEVGPLFKKKLSNFLLMQILSFKNGSIVTNSAMLFSSNNVSLAQVKDTFVSGLSNLTFSVNPNSIDITQTVGNSMPPVMASSVSMICVSLLSLLLSFALHF